MRDLIRQPPTSALPYVCSHQSTRPRLKYLTRNYSLVVHTSSQLWSGLVQSRQHVLHTLSHAAGSSLQLTRHIHLAPRDHWYGLGLPLATWRFQAKDDIRCA